MRRSLIRVNLLAAAAILLALPAPAQALEQRLAAATGAPSEEAARSVAVDGDTAVVGSHSADGRGAAYVFTRSGDTWTQTAKLTASDGASGDGLGWSVAIAGDTIVVGAPFDTVGVNFFQGSAYTFTRTGAPDRMQTAKLTASDGLSSDNLGLSVAIDGDTIVAGAPGDKIGANSGQGSAYTFAATGGPDRTQTAKLTASDGTAFDGLGGSVAIEGDTIVAGVPFDAVGTIPGRGSVCTFARTGAAARTQTARLIASDGATQDNLGASVDIDGDTIVAGAPFDTVGANGGQGSVYTFARTGATARTQTAKLRASDGATDDNLGWSASIDGETIVGGAPGDDIAASSDEGSVYAFARTGATARTEASKLAASDGAAGDLLGYSAAIERDTIVAGAVRDNVGANTNQGSATVFYSAAPTGAYAAAVLTDGPAGYWRFGEPAGLSAFDSSANGNDGTYVGGPVLGVPGALAADPDTAVSMDGTDDTVRVPDGDTLDVGNTFSAEGWIKRSSTAQTHTMMVKGFQIVVMNAGSGSQVWLRKPNVSTIARTNVGVGADVYHYIVVTKNGSGAGAVKIYIDGVSVPVVDVSPAQVIADTTGVLAFGAAGGNQANFDEFALYDQVLTPTQVAAHFAAGSGGGAT